MNQIKINELRKILLTKKDENIFVVFSASWCPYCKKNLPFIIGEVSKKNIKNFFVVDVSDENDDVWKETGNTEWALELVPTCRIYKNNMVIFNHKNIIDETKLNLAFNIYFEDGK